jgi:hypothetical protein
MPAVPMTEENVWPKTEGGNTSAETKPTKAAGGRRSPLEDSGGLPGYEEIMDAPADQSRPDHAECSAWVADVTGSDAPFDPAFLDAPA